MAGPLLSQPGEDSKASPPPFAPRAAPPRPGAFFARSSTPTPGLFFVRLLARALRLTAQRLSARPDAGSTASLGPRCAPPPAAWASSLAPLRDYPRRDLKDIDTLKLCSYWPVTSAAPRPPLRRSRCAVGAADPAGAQVPQRRIPGAGGDRRRLPRRGAPGGASRCVRSGGTGPRRPGEGHEAPLGAG